MGRATTTSPKTSMTEFLRVALKPLIMAIEATRVVTPRLRPRMESREVRLRSCRPDPRSLQVSHILNIRRALLSVGSPWVFSFREGQRGGLLRSRLLRPRLLGLLPRGSLVRGSPGVLNRLG